MLVFPNAIMNFFMNPTPSVEVIAPGILRTYGISYLLLNRKMLKSGRFPAILKTLPVTGVKTDDRERCIYPA